MTKARDLANLIAAGNPLADGAISVAEISDLTASAADAEAKAWADGADDRATAANRETRNQLLSDSDWTQFNDSPLTGDVKTSWATYRQTLRDITSTDDWPNVLFPATP